MIRLYISLSMQAYNLKNTDIISKTRGGYDLYYRNLTISWDAIRLAGLGVTSISCGLLHSCGVLRLPICSHILGWWGRKNVRICSAIWEKKQKTTVRKEEERKMNKFYSQDDNATSLTDKFLVTLLFLFNNFDFNSFNTEPRWRIRSIIKLI